MLHYLSKNVLLCCFFCLNEDMIMIVDNNVDIIKIDEELKSYKLSLSLCADRLLIDDLSQKIIYIMYFVTTNTYLQYPL